jgi:hypothetical protein
MGWFSEDSFQANAYDQVTQRPHEASWSHELIGNVFNTDYSNLKIWFDKIVAGAAAFEAAKAYENHLAENGQPDSHATAKELMSVTSLVVRTHTCH